VRKVESRRFQLNPGQFQTAVRLLNRGLLIAARVLARSIKNQLYSVRDSHLFKNPVEVITYRVLLNAEFPSYFAIFQALSYEPNNLFFASS